MRTSKFLEELLLDYAKNIYGSKNQIHEDFDVKFLLKINHLINKFPYLFYTLCDENISLEKAEELFKNIKNS